MVYFLIFVLTFPFSIYPQTETNQKTFEKLMQFLSSSWSDKYSPADKPVLELIVDSVSDDGSQVKLTNGLIFSINWWYRSCSKNWKKNDRLYICFSFLCQQLQLEHVDSKEIAWASTSVIASQPLPLVQHVQIKKNKWKNHCKIVINDGYIFETLQDVSDWKTNDPLIILRNSQAEYQLWNLNKSSVAQCIVTMCDVLGIEGRIKQKVLQQPGATHTIATALLSYTAGLNSQERPIGVFLFLGPTGVGKTELAKVIAEEMYHTRSKILRFDMSHFAEYHSLSRLIGSPPGYVNHEEGGQLTQPLLEDPSQVILLDEMEKAHPRVLKAFLPVFDEGYICDNKNRHVDCCEAIFIMTSNLLGPEIAELFNQGLSDEEIMTTIEPLIIEQLSPEFYNRIEPVLFRPIAKETMDALVELMLKQLKDRILEKGITVLFDSSVNQFLATKGYHPLLGARPLKKLIEKKIVSAIASYIIQVNPPEGTILTCTYDIENDMLHVINSP